MRISEELSETIVAHYSKRDAIIYNIGIGCSDLRHVYENHETFSVFPTIALALTLKGNSSDVQPFPPPFYRMARLNANGPVLDGERLLTINRPLRPSDTLQMSTRDIAISQASSGAISQTMTILSDPDSGEIVATIHSNTFFVGVSDAVPMGSLKTLVRAIPSSEPPRWTVDFTPHANQPAIYRLSGDYNPLHIDPEIAGVLGYKEPIMHGLCTLGMATNILVATCLGGNDSRLKQVGCRFSKPAFPGRTLTIEIWQTTNPDHLTFPFRVRDKSSNAIVIDKAFVDTSIVENARL